MFVSRSIQKHPNLAGAAGAATDIKKYNDTGIEINNYFRRLLGEH
jgi:hypothetical protein